MGFDIQIWRDQLSCQMESWKDRWEQARSIGISSLYAFLSAMALWPVVEAVRQGDLAALVALGGVVAGKGSNLLANQIQSWKDEMHAAQQLALAVEDNKEIRAALDAVLERLEVMTQTGAALDKEDRRQFATTLREELARLGNLGRFDATLQSVVVGWDMRESVVVTGDNNSVTYIAHQYLAEGGRSPDQIVLHEQITGYLTWMRERFGTIELRGIKREGQQVVQLDLETVYVPLEAEVLVEGERWHFTHLDHVLNLGTRLVITGGRGSGKTTVLQYIAWTLATAIAADAPVIAHQRLGLEGVLPLPVFIPLSAYAQYLHGLSLSIDPSERTLATFISRYLIERQSGLDLPRDFFARLLDSGQAMILLLDGSDEVPNEDERVQVCEAIKDLCTGREKMRVVVTCRTAAYRGRTALGRRFREVRVRALEDRHIESLVQQAYAAIYPHDPTARQSKADELLRGIHNLESERQRRLGERAERLVTSPLLVRMLLVVHFSERRLPEQRAELYMKATDAMLLPEYALDEAVAERVGRLVGGSREIRRELAQHLAFAMHRRGETQGREIGERDLRRVLGAVSSFSPLVGDFIALTRMRGMLLEERMGTYRFIHLGFQEYLVARYLTEVRRGEGGVESIAAFFEEGPILDSWWWEPALLVAGYLSLTSPQTARLFLHRLASTDTDAVRRSPLSPDMQLVTADIAAMAFLEWQTEDAELRRVLAERVAALFKNTTLMTRARAVLRVRAGDSLAQLGDSRPGVGVDPETALPDIVWFNIPAGLFMMGSTNDDKMASSGEKPRHCNESITESYLIGRYPVTNIQFNTFVKAGGYRERRYWTKAGWAWMEGKGRIRTDDYSESLKLPNHPVIGVTWYEAVAFCHWLTERLRERGKLTADEEISLPTETQWEKAARGTDGRSYPWGNNHDPERANYKDTGIRTTSAVGCFPGGASPYGVEDLSGNVWEWTQSLYKSYPYDPLDGREDLESDGVRVLRGGAFYNEARDIRCAFRIWVFPEYCCKNFGFRVAMSTVHI